MKYNRELILAIVLMLIGFVLMNHSIIISQTGSRLFIQVPYTRYKQNATDPSGNQLAVGYNNLYAKSGGFYYIKDKGSAVSLLDSTNNLASTGDIAINTNKFTVAHATGNTLIAGTLSETGDFALNTNKVTMTASSGNASFAGTLASTGNFSVNTNKFSVTASSGAITGLSDLNIGGTIGSPKMTVTGSTGAASFAGAITSTVTTGTAPMVVSSTTKVSNLNADLLDGTDWAAPGDIGTTTPGKGSFTRINSAVNSITPGATITLDSTLGNVFTLTPGQDETINASVVGVAGQYLDIIVTTSGTSSWNLTFGTNFKSTGVLATGTVSAKVFDIGFVSNGSTYVERFRTTAQ